MDHNLNEKAGAMSRRFDPWPVGIFAAFAVFIALNAVFVTAAVSSRPDLVTRDYYDDELRYQQRMDQLRRTAPWRERIHVKWRAGELQLALPVEHAAAGANGKLVLYRPSAAADDAEWPLALDQKGEQRIPAATLAVGLWKAQLHWTVGGESFYFDEPLVINGPREVIPPR
jgi:nitrogen fixation protein FixH